MPDIPLFDLREDEDGVVFKVSVQPAASREEVAGLHDRALRLRLTAPPIEGAANEACRVFLADLFHVSKGRVRIIRGHRSRRKWIHIRGATRRTILERLKTQS
jgi:uncharacterized protein (TIGR00251 family)